MSQLDLTLKTEMAPITAASMEQGAYERSYEHLVKLQILNEIHSAAEMLVFVDIRDLPPAEVVDDLAKTWRNRTTVAQYSPKFLEQVLKVRRCIMDVAAQRVPASSELHRALNRSLSECWTLGAKVARKSGQSSKAYNLLLEAEKYSKEELFLERAKLGCHSHSLLMGKKF